MKSLHIKLLLLLIGAVACARGSAQNLRLENADGVFSLGDTVRVWATAMDGSDSLVFRKCFNSPTEYFKGLLYMEAGLIDATCPPAGIVAGYNNSGAIQKEIHFFPYRGHTNWTCYSKDEWDRTVLRERIRFIEDYLR